MPASESGKTLPQSRIIPGPPHLRHYAAHRLVTWRPEGVLDDALLDSIAEWIFLIEKVSLPFKRFIDFSRLTIVSVRTGHVFDVAKHRADEFKGIAPVRTALFSDDWVGFGIARLYESLMEGTLIQARAFRERSGAAGWLEVPENILTADDVPAGSH